MSSSGTSCVVLLARAWLNARYRQHHRDCAWSARGSPARKPPSDDAPYERARSGFLVEQVVEEASHGIFGELSRNQDVGVHAADPLTAPKHHPSAIAALDVEFVAAMDVEPHARRLRTVAGELDASLVASRSAVMLAVVLGAHRNRRGGGQGEPSARPAGRRCRRRGTVQHALEPGALAVMCDFPFPDSDHGFAMVPGRVIAGIQFFEAQIA